MYFYANSSDYRFYSHRLLELGADVGDIVQIRRLIGENCEFQCVLARQGTTTYNDWRNFCVRPIRNSVRKYGYA